MPIEAWTANVLFRAYPGGFCWGSRHADAQVFENGTLGGVLRLFF